MRHPSRCGRSSRAGPGGQRVPGAHLESRRHRRALRRAAAAGRGAFDGERARLAPAGSGRTWCPSWTPAEAAASWRRPAGRSGRRCSSIFGPADARPGALATARRTRTPRAFDVRAQPAAPWCWTGQPGRPAGPGPAAVHRRGLRRRPARLRGDVRGGGRLLAADRRRLLLPGSASRSLIRQGHSFVGPGRGRPGAASRPNWATVSPRATQIQGVWVDPAHRGRGLRRALHGRRRPGYALAVAPR